MAYGMPRSDVFTGPAPGHRLRRLGAARLRPGFALRSSAPQLPQRLLGTGAHRSARAPAATARLELRAELEDGGAALAELGRSRSARSRPSPRRSTRPSRPPAAAGRDLHGHLRAAARAVRRQLESIRAQTHRNWVCVISDDCSGPERFAELEDARRRRPALRRLALAAPAAASTATSSARWRWRRPAPTTSRMADQDDRWHPDKLETLLGAIGDAQLVYSDAAHRQRGRRADRRHLLEPAPQQPPRPRSRC